MLNAMLNVQGQSAMVEKHIAVLLPLTLIITIQKLKKYLFQVIGGAMLSIAVSRHGKLAENFLQEEAKHPRGRLGVRIRNN